LAGAKIDFSEVHKTTALSVAGVLATMFLVGAEYAKVKE
jgi:hypothetical protein